MRSSTAGYLTHLFAVEQPGAQSPSFGVAQAVGLGFPLSQTLGAAAEPAGGVDGRLNSLATAVHNKPCANTGGRGYSREKARTSVRIEIIAYKRRRCMGYNDAIACVWYLYILAS